MTADPEALRRIVAEGRERYDGTVTVRCVGCKSERNIKPNKIPKNDMPMCAKCYLPMVVVCVAAKRRRARA